MSRFVYEVYEGVGRLIDFDPTSSADVFEVRGAIDGFVSFGNISHKMRHGVAHIPTGGLGEGITAPTLITDAGSIAMDPINVRDGVASPDKEAILLRISRDLATLVKRVNNDEGRLALLDGAVFRTTLF